MRITGRTFRTTHRLFKFGDCLIIVPLQLRIHGI